MEIRNKIKLRWYLTEKVRCLFKTMQAIRKLYRSCSARVIKELISKHSPSRKLHQYFNGEGLLPLQSPASDKKTLQKLSTSDQTN